MAVSGQRNALTALPTVRRDGTLWTGGSVSLRASTDNFWTKNMSSACWDLNSGPSGRVRPPGP